MLFAIIASLTQNLKKREMENKRIFILSFDILDSLVGVY